MKISEKKIINAIIFFASKSPENKINRLKLVKLLWLADRIHLNKYGRSILRDNYSALPHGPVPSKTLTITRTVADGSLVSSCHDVLAINPFDMRFFSESDIEVMNYVWSKYGQMTQFELRDLSHKFPEWLRYEADLKDKNSPNSYQMVLDDFFAAPLENVDYYHDGEKSKVAQRYYHSYASIQSFLAE